MLNRFRRFFFPLLALTLLLFVLPALALAGDLQNPERMAQYADLAGLVVLVASAVANLTKTDKDNKAVGLVSKLVNLFALNFKRSGL